MDKLEIIEKIMSLNKEKVFGQGETINKINTTLDKSINPLNPPCPKCSSQNVIKRGTRKTLRRGNVQRYGCNDCDWKFSEYGKDFRMRNNMEKIEKALELRKQGKTYSQIANKLSERISRQTVRRWLHKFQPPKKPITITRKIKNQYGEYERSFKIKI